MNSCNTNHILKDVSYIWILPPSTTSGYLVILHNSDTIPLPSSATVLPLPLGFPAAPSTPAICLALPSHHHLTPPYIFPTTSPLSSLYFLSNLFPFPIYLLSRFPLSVLSQVRKSQHWKGLGAHGDRTQPVSHRRDTRCRQRKLRFSKVPVETGNRAQPALPQSQSSSHTIAAFQTGRHHKDQAQPPHFR